MDKSPDAFRTISEVADWLGTPTHVLRFWESRFTQVKPVKRAGGRRYYRPADMVLLGGIKKLLHNDGMTIRGVQKLLREEGVRHVASLSAPIDGEDFIDGSVVELSAAPEPDPGEARIHLDVPSAPLDNVVPLGAAQAERVPPGSPETTPPPFAASEAPADLAGGTRADAASDTAVEPEDADITTAADAGTEQDSDTADAATAETRDSAAAEPSDARDAADASADAGTEPAADSAPAEDAAVEAEAPGPAPIIASVPDDPADDDIAVPEITDVAASLRRAATGHRPQMPEPEVFGALYQRLLKLRARMDDDGPARSPD